MSVYRSGLQPFDFNAWAAALPDRLVTFEHWKAALRGLRVDWTIRELPGSIEIKLGREPAEYPLVRQALLDRRPAVVALSIEVSPL